MNSEGPTVALTLGIMKVMKIFKEEYKLNGNSESICWVNYLTSLEYSGWNLETRCTPKLQTVTRNYG